MSNNNKKYILRKPILFKVNRQQCEYHLNPLAVDNVKPGFSWLIEEKNQRRKPIRGVKQLAYRILVASSKELLRQNNGDLWDSGKVKSKQNIQVIYSGKPLISRQKCFWKVKVWTTSVLGHSVTEWSYPSFWKMGLLKPDDWKAKWIELRPEAGCADFPYLRKSFKLDKRPKTAFIYINSLGYHELYINGKKVGDDVLSPAVSELSKRSLYLVHDISSYLRRGENCVAISLGRGGMKRAPLVRVQLELHSKDNGQIALISDSSWQGSPSPYSSITRWGVCYDARLDQPGWNTAGFDDRHWMPVALCDIQVPITSAQIVETNRILYNVSPTSIKSHGKKAWMIDMGTNMVGWLTLKIHNSRKAGREIILSYGDNMLNGKVKTLDWDKYITSGKGEEVFTPKLSYQAFRYVTISGLENKPSRDDVSASFIRTDYKSDSLFECSNLRLNSIYNMIAYTLQCITLGGYMVDCPHLERLGYGGDGQATAETAMMTSDLAPLYRSWLTAWRDCQRDNGDMPHVAPYYFAGGGPYWCGFIITVSWQVYIQYGDKSVLNDNYTAMQKWLDFIEQYCSNAGVMENWESNTIRSWSLGDWATPEGSDDPNNFPAKLVGNCYRIHCYDLMTRIARVINKHDDVRHYQTKAQSLRPIIHQALFNTSKNTYASGNQLDLAYPLLTDIVPDNRKSDIAGQLEQNIMVKNNGHLDVGLVGVPVLVKTLMKLSRNDLIFTMVNQKTFPGWGYMLENGATTTWEHWKGKRSYIHNCYNGIGMWFYQGPGGVKLLDDIPAYKEFKIEPSVVGDITWVKCRCSTISGIIISNWELLENGFKMTIKIPINTTATVYLPSKDISKITESGKSIQKTDGIKFLRREKEYTVFKVGSGYYEFVS